MIWEENSVLPLESLLLWSKGCPDIFTPQLDPQCPLQFTDDLLVGNRLPRLVLIYHLWFLVDPLVPPGRKEGREGVDSNKESAHMHTQDRGGGRREEGSQEERKG